ncbi:MAG: DUF3078 domain-containing protein [Ignavibacteriae bacterium]|nr:DUF3078 domain-containing protein [Ignavibacteriota bacterium]
MRKLIFFTIILTISILAEDAKKDSVAQKTWLPIGVAGINLSQIALDNWTQGGEDALAFSLYGNFGLDYFDKPWSFTNKLKLAFGKTKLGSEDYKTTDNEIFLEDLLTYSAGWFADPYFANTFRTVIANGYDYSGDSPIQTASFFDPGYLMQSIGMAYKISDNFTTRLGFGFQETFTSKFNSYSDDVETLDEVEKFRFETGIESVTSANFKLDDNLFYTSELRLFGAFDALDIWDVRFDNILTAQVTKLVNVNFNVLLIYDEDQVKRTQMKEALQIGIAYALF